MKLILLAFMGLSLIGCVTLSGNYAISAKDANGKPYNGGVNFHAQGSGIYTVRNAMCKSYPGAVITIIDTNTGKELASESPYTCRK